MEKTDHLRAWGRLVDGALASEMVFNTRSGRLIGSRRAAKGGEQTARVEGAILFRSPERGDPVSGTWARGLLSAAESVLTTKVDNHLVSLFPDSPDDLWNQGDRGGMHKGGGWANRGPTRP